MASDLKKKKNVAETDQIANHWCSVLQSVNQRILRRLQVPGGKLQLATWKCNLQPSDRTGAVTNTFPQDNSTYRQITDQSILTGHEIHE